MNLSSLKSTRFAFLPLILVLTGHSGQAQGATYYVEAGASGGNGSSWAKAFNNLDEALMAAINNPGADSIWVAKGTYKPTVVYGGLYEGTETNLKTFKLPSDVTIYGGFNGTENQLSKRNRDANPTILSGDLRGDDINDPSNTKTNKLDNAYHVLTAEGVSGVVLDSLIVSGGYAKGPDSGTVDARSNLLTLDYSHDGGGGLIARYGSQVTLNKVLFKYNVADATYATLRNPILPGPPAIAAGGGAVLAQDEGTLVKISNSIFDYNSAVGFGSGGGALNAQLEAALDISSSVFTNNVADRNGGAIRGKDLDKGITLSASEFRNNAVVGVTIGDESGGAIGSINANVSVVSSTFDSNSSGPIAGGGGIFFHNTFDTGDVYSLIVDKSTFINNRGASLGGGGILIFGLLQNVGSQALISNSVFLNNSGGTGGAVFSDSLPALITNSTFKGNKAWTQGGALFVANFDQAIFDVTDIEQRFLVQVSGSLFESNAIVGVPPTAFVAPEIAFDIFAGALAHNFGQPHAGVHLMTPGGGAIAAEFGAHLQISKSTFKKNNAQGGYGGAILVGGKSGFSGTTLLGMNQAYVTYRQSSFCANNATEGGKKTAVLDPTNLGASPNGVQLVVIGQDDNNCQ